MADCAVEGCRETATLEVILYDFYAHHPDEPVFFGRDHTCPYLCNRHAIENEEKARGAREPRGEVDYPFSNKGGAQGFTIYRPIDS